MHQPPGFVSKTHPHHVCKLYKAIYGLKQAPRAWNARITRTLAHLWFVISNCDPSLFVFKGETTITYLLLYVDDIFIKRSLPVFLDIITTKLKSEFPITDTGKLSYFLGIKFEHNDAGMLLSQSQYAKDIMVHAGMSDCKPISTPVDVNSKLTADVGDPIKNPTEYRILAGAFQYLTFTRPDITYAVHQTCLFIHDPRAKHLHALRRIICYLKGTRKIFRGKLGTLTAWYSKVDLWLLCVS